MVVLTFYEVLVQLQILVFFCYDEERTITVHCSVDHHVSDAVVELTLVVIDGVERIEVFRFVKVDCVSDGVGLLYHAHGQLSQLLNDSLLAVFAALARPHTQNLLVVRNVLLYGRFCQIKQH
jgi:hypothetical protein